MSGDIYERIDLEEKKRIKQAAETFHKEKRISLSEIVGNETIERELIKGPRLWASSFPEANASLPLNSLIYSKILTSICPKCTCAKNPSLIKPYLERGVILPVLLNPLRDYSAAFANLIIQYPYIGAESYRFLRFVRRECSDVKGGMCTNCYSKKWIRILRDLDNLPILEKIKDPLKAGFMATSFWLYPAEEPEVSLLTSIENSVKQKENLKTFLPLAESAWTISNLRNSQVFRAIPQVSQLDLRNIAQVLRQKYAYKGNTHIQDKELALEALNLDYNPSMPVEDYLDIVLPRKKKINSLVDEILSSKGKQADFSRIEDEIWQINKEISTSKTLETLTFTTDFVFDNTRVLSSMLIGAMIGYSSGSFAACGMGSAIGLLTGGAVQRFSGKLKFKVRNYPRKTVEWLQSRIEGTEEQLLATILSKDISTIQVWSLRKKLKNEAL